MSLTARQTHIMEVIRDFSKRGYSPSIAEIGAAVGITTIYGVRYQLNALERKGFLRPRLKRQHRCIVLAEPLQTAA